MKREGLAVAVILLFLGLALVPSINAETSDTKKIQVDFKDLKGIISNRNNTKHPLLFLLIFSLIYIKFGRGFWLMVESSNYPYNIIWDEPLEIYNPINYYRGLWQGETSILLLTIWNGLSDEYGWNWDFGDLNFITIYR